MIPTLTPVPVNPNAFQFGEPCTAAPWLVTVGVGRDDGTDARDIVEAGQPLEALGTQVGFYVALPDVRDMTLLPRRAQASRSGLAVRTRRPRGPSSRGRPSPATSPTVLICA